MLGEQKKIQDSFYLTFNIKIVIVLKNYEIVNTIDNIQNDDSYCKYNFKKKKRIVVYHKGLDHWLKNLELLLDLSLQATQLL